MRLRPPTEPDHRRVGQRLLAIPKGPPAEALHDKNLGSVGPSPFQGQELLHFLHHGILGSLEQCATFSFPLGNALVQCLAVLPLLTETVAESHRKRRAIPQAAGRQIAAGSLRFGHHQTLRREQPLDAVEGRASEPAFPPQRGVGAWKAICIHQGDPFSPDGDGAGK